MRILMLLFLFVVNGQWSVAAGTSSWYGESHRGKLMANGQPFNPNALTCASWFYPLGTKLKVRHQNREVVVTVTDRGPARRLVRQGRVLDLSYAAFTKLADPDLGLIEVEISPIPKDPRP